jgi:hypothetical protein
MTSVEPAHDRGAMFLRGSSAMEPPAERCDRSAELRFGHPVDVVFEMFTPEGERAWAPEWDPHPLVPGETDVRDAVFTTEHRGAHAVWFVVELDRSAHRASYVNFVARIRLTRVDVECEAAGPAETTVSVRYVVTGLSPQGNRYVREFDAHFDGMMADWQTAVAAALETAGEPGLVGYGVSPTTAGAPMRTSTPSE